VKKIAAIAFQAWLLFHFLFWLIILYLPLRLLLASPKGYNIALLLQRFWAKFLRVISGIQVSVIKPESPPTAPCIYVANHNNFLDILVGYKVFNNYFHYMAKASLARVPIFGILFKYTHIPFERSNSSDSSRAFIRALQDLEKGYSIAIFPEGTQNPNPNSLLPFKHGAFKLAIQAGVPIVPVRFYNHLDRLPHAKSLFKWGSTAGPGKVTSKIMEPIYPQTDMNPAELAEKVRKLLME
jgi:1-acyl-sn-glycerol-3-phosphate acyltransferase